jgi:hypothetical protein
MAILPVKITVERLLVIRCSVAGSTTLRQSWILEATAKTSLAANKKSQKPFLHDYIRLMD